MYFYYTICNIRKDNQMENDLLEFLETHEDKPSLVKTQETMSAIADLIDKIDALEKEENRLYEEQKKIAAEKRVLVEEVVPSLMQENGFTSLTLDDGRKLTYKEEYFAHISEANTHAAMTWLRANGLADIIKNEYKIAFTAKQADKAEQFESLLKMSGNMYTNKQGVHPSTLKSMVNKYIADGNMPPQDVFGIYQKKSVVIKNR